ncbi:MAG: hypothetical protein JSS32_00625 [Verrucomicrobia bacterium]|nr:hypothetical protein [Verrucomicrobiota bacterium]
MAVSLVNSENRIIIRDRTCSLKKVLVFALLAIGAVGLFFNLPGASAAQPQSALALKLPQYYNMSAHSPIYYRPRLPPPLPQSHPLQPRGVEGWINGHCFFQRPMARKIMKMVRHIPYGEFKTALLSTVRHFNSKIEGLPPNDRDYIAIARNYKSNGWVTDLVLPHLTHLPTAIVNWDSSVKYFRKTHNVKRVVLFDDATYSGSQLSYMISTLVDLKMDFSPDPAFKIYAAVPFMTNPERVVHDSIRPYVEIMEHVHLQTVGEAFSEAECRVLESQYDLSQESRGSMGLTYFDHKVPDYLSFPNFLAKSLTAEAEHCNPQCMDEPIIEEFTPPYKEDWEVINDS